MKSVTRRGGGLLATLLIFFVCCPVCLVCLASCNVTRVITTTQTHLKNGDTISVMTTKTSESYSATKVL